MASERETVEDIVREMRGEAVSRHPLDERMCDFSSRIESAWRREKAELERKAREHHLAFLAERARRTATYKDERIRAQDAEIKTLKNELKVAKDALECADWLVGRYCPNPALEGDRKKVKRMNRALAAIREEGGDANGVKPR